MADDGFHYTATEDLRLVRALRGYNRYIARLFAATWMRQAAERAGAPAGIPRVLDFGAGIGTIAKLFEAETGIRPLAFDADAAHLTTLRAAGFTAIERIEDVPDASLDCVFSSNVLEHIEDDRAALALLHRKLKPGGAIALYVPAFMQLWSRLDDVVGHRRRYTKAELVEKITAAGFTVERAHYCDCMGYVMTRLFRRRVTIAADMSPLALRVFDRIVFPASRLLDPLVRGRFGKNLFVAARRG